MTKRKAMSIVGLSLMALLIVCLFLPFISDGDYTMSLWKLMDQNDRIEVDIILLITLIIAMLVFVLQLCGALKDAKFAYFTLGYYFLNFIDVFITMIKKDGFKYLSIGFYFGLIISIISIIVVAIGGFLSNDKSGKKEYNQPIGYDPKTGKPIYEESKKIVRYDPQTGEPIYKK